MDVSPPPLRGIQIDGTLRFADMDLRLSADWIMVHGPGKFAIGSSTSPYTKSAVITLMGQNQQESIMGMGTKCIAAMMGGQLEFFGASKTTWSKLRVTAFPGDRQITVTNSVGWKVGDRLVLAPSTFESTQAEERIIAAIQGQIVTLDSPVLNRHWGTLQTISGRTIDERAEVLNLTRNILITSDASSNQSKFGGHVMVMDAGSNARIMNVEFDRMGQFNRLGRYPMHWHLVRSAAGGFFRNNSIHDSFQRGLVVHGTDSVSVQNNVIYNTVGHAYALEDGSETGNTFNLNIGLNPIPTNLPALNQNDTKAAVFWIRSLANTFTRNVAAGGPQAGFWFDNPLQSSTRLSFRNNVAHSHGYDERPGVWVHYEIDHGPEVFDLYNHFGYKNGNGTWGNRLIRSIDSLYAGNMTAVRQGEIVSSLVIGRTANVGTETPGWFNDYIGGGGAREYGAGTTLKNVKFANFFQGGAALTTVVCAKEWPRFTTSAITLDNATGAKFCGGDVVVSDLDGSLTGMGPNSMLISEAPFMRVPGCQARPAWGSFACPSRVNYQKLFLERDPHLPISLTSDSGIVQNEMVDFPFYSVLIDKASYRINTDLAAFSGIRVLPFGESALSTLVIPAASPNFAVYQSTTSFCYMCNPVRSPAHYGPIVAPSVSRQAFDSLTSSGYFYDATAKLAYFKLATGRPLLIERR